MSVALTGLGSGGPNEERALASLVVEHNGQTYDWAIFIPTNLDTDLGTFLQSKESAIYAEIDAKEAEWEALTPKTTEYTDPFTGFKTVTEIPKSSIVHPDIPDYYAKRRAEYPALSEQLDALWKGGDAATAMANRIKAVKDKYPKS